MVRASKKSSGGALELAPLAATGLLLTAEEIYRNMLAADKRRSAVPRRYRGGDGEPTGFVAPPPPSMVGPATGGARKKAPARRKQKGGDYASVMEGFANAEDEVKKMQAIASENESTTHGGAAARKKAPARRKQKGGDYASVMEGFAAMQEDLKKLQANPNYPTETIDGGAARKKKAPARHKQKGGDYASVMEGFTSPADMQRKAEVANPNYPTGDGVPAPVPMEGGARKKRGGSKEEREREQEREDRERELEGGARKKRGGSKEEREREDREREDREREREGGAKKKRAHRKQKGGFFEGFATEDDAKKPSATPSGGNTPAAEDMGAKDAPTTDSSLEPADVPSSSQDGGARKRKAGAKRPAKKGGAAIPGFADQFEALTRQAMGSF